MKKLFLAIFGFIALSGLALNTSAGLLAVAVPDITWTGTCLDCVDGPTGVAGSGGDNGNATMANAELFVTSKGNGGGGATNLGSGNLTAFNYFSEFVDSLYSTSILWAFGSIAQGISQSYVDIGFAVGDDNYTFSSTGLNNDSSGNWSLHPCDGNCPQPSDVGTASTFDAPEPGTIALFGLGLLGLARVRRRS